MDDLVARIFENLSDRVAGPMTFRLVLQPLMATFFAVRSGLQDAREGRPAYFWALVTNPEHRRDMLKDGWKAVGKTFILAVIIDAIYQYIVLRWFYPGEAILVALILAIIPYLLIRGTVNRLTSRKGDR
jgi:hypothetical protein